MRRSEILALRWRDVDLISWGVVYVCRSMHQLRDNSIVFRKPKTERSGHTISLPPSAREVLIQHYGKQKVLCVILGRRLKDDDLVFCHEDGPPLLPDSVTHAWIKLSKKVGLNGVRLHDCRHTHATLLLKQGIHPKIVQERLGHSTISTTLDIYSHITPGLQEAAANRFDEMLLTNSASVSIQS